MINSQKDIRDITFKELTDYLVSRQEPVYRAKQIFEWIYKRSVNHFDEMLNLSLNLREKLKKDFAFNDLKVLREDVSQDGTTKALFELRDKEKIETVLIPTKKRTTLCISTQAGCKFGCKFCASGIGGWVRNLNPSEVFSQILYMKRKSQNHPVSHLVFMGVGEPLDNYDNLLQAIRIINADEGINIGARRITVSTCGVVPKILKLADEGLQIELAISLHGSSNESRNVLMPVNKKYPVVDLIAACREYIKATKRLITFEYILIKDITCTEKAAKELAQLLKGMLCKMNLIPYNPVSEFDHKTPSMHEMQTFRNQLEKLGIHATIRSPRGRDVAAACGQLRHSG